MMTVQEEDGEGGRLEAFNFKSRLALSYAPRKDCTSCAYPGVQHCLDVRHLHSPHCPVITVIFGHCRAGVHVHYSALIRASIQLR